jgi:primosomal protein N' (replication factor Y) (superfamily II helicase)
MAEHQNPPFLVADVVIDQAIPLVLTYAIPSFLQNADLIGKRCEVPFRNKTLKGFIFEVKEQDSIDKLKTLISISDCLHLPDKLMKLALWMSKYYVTPLSKVLHFFVPKIIKQQDMEEVFTHGKLNLSFKELMCDFIHLHHPKKKSLKSFISESLENDLTHSLTVLKKKLKKELFEVFQNNAWITFVKKTNTLEFENIASIKKILTHEQKKVASDLLDSLNQPQSSVHLLYGVCGSGKTEVYFEVIEEALKQKKGIIYLIPEVALAPQTISRIKKRFNVPISLIHHAVSDGVKKKDYEALLSGDVQFVVGARSAVFAPVKNLGLIIIDEEHESAYKQEGMPTYHAKDVAIMRARLENAMLILGSATPSIETFYQTTLGKIKRHHLMERPSSFSLPTIHLANLGTEFQKAQGLYLFAEKPLKELEDNFKRGEQSLIFINRRGYNSLQQCSSCAEAIKCKNCSIAMTFHKNDGLLSCHFCGYNQVPPQSCPLCGHATLQFKGVGTQQVEAKLHMFLKEAKILRVDKDTTSKKGSLETLFETFSSKGADILIGTQMIAKGLDFSHLTLAIILNIDGTFNRPDFRAHEEAFQLMTQVAGRAGRSCLKGQVFIQTHNIHHPLCLQAQAGDYFKFYESEIKERELYAYPPFSRLVRFLFAGRSQEKTLRYAENFRCFLLRSLPKDYTIEPIIPCFHEMIDNQFRFQFLIKGKQAIKLYEIIKDLDHNIKMPSDLRRLIDVDPLTIS